MAGVRFLELMHGPFALATVDPKAGSVAGRHAGTSLAMEIEAIIPDVRLFVSDPDHQGALEGAVSFAALGSRMPVKRGRFRLFVSDRSRPLKLMTYELLFESGGQDYFLAGTKEVRGSLLRGWTETTTLFCRLHAGSDGDAPLAGAGVLRLGPRDFLRQLASFRGIGTNSAAQKTGSILKFGRFFASELLDSYLW